VDPCHQHVAANRLLQAVLGFFFIEVRRVRAFENLCVCVSIALGQDAWQLFLYREWEPAPERLSYYFSLGAL
jgi:hypothetical protein